MSTTSRESDMLAANLSVALTRIRSRLREESHVGTLGLSATQLSILKRLRLKGQATAASLASAEHISQQGIAQCLSVLKATGLVRAKPDPIDRRKVTITITQDGLALRDSLLAARNAWLSASIKTALSSDERRVIGNATKLLERLAETD